MYKKIHKINLNMNPNTKPLYQLSQSRSKPAV